MKQRRVTSFLLVLFFNIVFICTSPGIAMAGPGGIIAKPLNAFLWLVAIILFPFYLYVVTKENLAARRAKKALNMLAIMNDNFRWPVINERAHAIVSQVYSAWNKADIERAKEWMTDWYWQNQKRNSLLQ